MVCPQCRLPAVPIIYGDPSKESVAAASAGLLVLGGCMVGPGVPNLACPRGHRWRSGEPNGSGGPDGSDGSDAGERSDAADRPATAEESATRRYVAGDLDGADPRSATFPPGGRRRAWGGWGLTVALSWRLVAWVVTPLVWIIVSDEVAPESGVDPTPAQVRTMGWVDLSWWTVAVALPLIVFTVAALTRRRFLTFLGAAGVIVPNLLLILRGHPIWELLAVAVDMIVTGVAPGSGV